MTCEVTCNDVLKENVSTFFVPQDKLVSVSASPPQEQARTYEPGVVRKNKNEVHEKIYNEQWISRIPLSCYSAYTP